MDSKKKQKAQSPTFSAFVGTLDYLQVCRVIVSPAGEFSVPDEDGGRITSVDASTRKKLAKFVRAFADRLETPPPVQKRRRR